MRRAEAEGLNVPEPTPDINAVFSRVLTHADRLFEALEDLEAAGGFGALAGAMKPASVERLATGLKSVREAIDGELAGLKAVRQGPVKRRPPGG